MFGNQLWNDRDGAILPYVAIMLVAIFALSALAIDASRLMNVQTQLQNGADALAAGASYLVVGRPIVQAADPAAAAAVIVADMKVGI